MRREPSVGPEREITVHLARVQGSEVGHAKDAYFKTVQDAYANRYLLALGVAPTEKNRRLVAQNAPLARCEIEATWGRGSAVASELRIVQPPPGGFKKAEKKVEVQALDEETLREIELRHGPQESFSTDVPYVPDAAAVMAKLGRATSAGRSGEEGTDQEMNFVPSQVREWGASETEGVDASLVDELERVRKMARGETVVADGVPVLMRWGEDGERELNLLKKKFILPFAAQRPAKPGKDEQVIVPWQTPELLGPIRVPRELLEEVCRPLAVPLEVIAEDTAQYVGKRLPLELLTTRRDPWQFQALRDRLCCAESVQLSALMAHLAYWTMFGHAHPPEERLPSHTKQSLTLKMQELWSALLQPARASQSRLGPQGGEPPEKAALFMRPVCLLAAKRGAERVLHIQYPRLFTDPDHGAALSQQIWDGINVLMMNIFDPDCQYASFGVLNSSLGAIRLERNLSVAQMKLGLPPSIRMINSCYRTTPMVTLMMNADGCGPASPKTRKLLMKSSSDAVLSAVSGSAGARGERRREGVPLMEAKRRAALYRTASSRLQASAAEIIGPPTSSGARRTSAVAS